MTELAGKTALITGSTQGIGLGIARAFAAAGARVAVHGLEEPTDLCAGLMRAGAADAVFLPGDLRSADGAAKLMEGAAAWGGVDILVNNAGINHGRPLAEMPYGEWCEVLQINLSSAFLTMQAALPGMAARGYGRVINIASIHGMVGNPGKAAYAAAKAGMIGLSRVAAAEYAEAGDAASGGVTVNCICPGWVDTPLVAPMIAEREALLGTGREAAIADLLGEKQPTRRAIDPAEIGAMALWLCSKLAHNVTGTAMPIDGGWTAR